MDGWMRTLLSFLGVRVSLRFKRVCFVICFVPGVKVEQDSFLNQSRRAKGGTKKTFGNGEVGAGLYEGTREEGKSRRGCVVLLLWRGVDRDFLLCC
jgi:hypothetical protein